MAESTLMTRSGHWELGQSFAVPWKMCSDPAELKFGTQHLRISFKWVPRRREDRMAVTAGYYLSGVIALAIIVIGARFFIAPRAAAAAYGLAVTPDQTRDAFLSVKG